MTLLPFDFHHPTRLLFGVGALERLGQEARSLGARALLVSYRDQSGLEAVLGRVGETLQSGGLEVVPFFELDPDPLESTGREGAAFAKREGIELVVGVGGGSAMDVAKGIAGLAVSGGTPWDYTRCNSDRIPFAGALPVIAIPTTAGTGSEMTNTVVFSHPDRDLKAAIVEPALFPTLALVDPQLMTGAPPRLTAQCGIDALGQCIEAHLSKTTSPVCQALAAEGFRYLFGALPAAVEAGDDVNARARVALGATLSGMAISHGGTCATHAMSHALGALLHVPHGLGVGVCTTSVLRYCTEGAADRIASLAYATQTCGRDVSAVAAAELFIQSVETFLTRIGVPSSLAGDGTEDLPERLTDNAFRSTPAAVGNTPREMTREAMVAIFKRVLT